MSRAVCQLSHSEAWCKLEESQSSAGASGTSSGSQITLECGSAAAGSFRKNRYCQHRMRPDELRFLGTILNRPDSLSSARSAAWRQLLGTNGPLRSRSRTSSSVQTARSPARSTHSRSGSSGNFVGEFRLLPPSPKAPLACACLVARVHSSARGSAFVGGSPVRAEDSGSSGFALNEFGFRNAQAVGLPCFPP